MIANSLIFFSNILIKKPKTVLFVWEFSSFQKPEQADPEAHGRHTAGTRGPNARCFNYKMTENWGHQEGGSNCYKSTRTLAPSPGNTAILTATLVVYIKQFPRPRCLVPKAGRMAVSERPWRKQDAQTVLAQLGSQPPGYVMPRRRADRSQTLACTPATNQLRPLISLYDQTVITLQRLLGYYIFIAVMS